MAVTTFIPQVWERGLLRALRRTLIFGQPAIMTVRPAPSGAQQGDRVNIPFLGAVSTFDYVRNTPMPAPDILDTTQVQLLIDKAQAYNLLVDDIDQAQAAGDLLGPGRDEAAFQLNLAADTYAAATLVAGVDAGNVLGTTVSPIALTAANIYDQLVDLGTMLSNDLAPTLNRWAVLTPALHGLLAKSEQFTKASALGDQVAVNGRVGRAAGFDIYETTGMPAPGGSATNQLVAGVPGAVAWVDQINKTETIKTPDYFGDILRGLHVYGAKVYRPTLLAKIIATVA